MLRMVSYFRRSQSGQIMCYLNRTYHVLLTFDCGVICGGVRLCLPTGLSGVSSAVERELPKLDVTGSIPVPRSKTFVSGRIQFPVTADPSTRTKVLARDDSEVVLSAAAPPCAASPPPTPATSWP